MLRRLGRASARFGTTALLTWLALAGSGTSVLASEDQASLDEYRVKGALLANFVKFVQWQHGGAITVCLAGDAPGVDVVARGKTVNGDQIVTRRVEPDSDLTHCDVLFVSASVGRHTGDMLKRLGTAPVLTVGEIDPFLNDGGIVRFFIEANRIRFQINAKAADDRGVKISSQLLSLAAR